MTRAVVIGAGVGGLSAATHLARRGLRVTVVDKNCAPGGRLGRFSRDGHTFSTGPTLLIMPLLYRSELAALGIDYDETLRPVRVDPTYDMVFDDGSRLSMTSDLVAMRDQLEAVEPGAFGGYLRYLEEGRRHYELGVPGLAQRDFRRATDFFRPSTLVLALRVKALQRHYRHVGRFVSSPRLRAALTCQDVYMGLSPFTAPSTFSLTPFSELAHGVWAPTGGMYRIAEVLAEAAADVGVELVLGEQVHRIALAGDRATGVELGDGRLLPADVVVATADLPYVYRHLLPDRAPAEALARKRFSGSTISFFWGLDRQYPQLRPHTLFLGDAYRENFDRIDRNLPLPDLPSVYLHAPTALDPGAAPPGRDTLVAVVPSGHLGYDGDDPARREREAAVWEVERDRARTAVLTRLASIGLADAADHVVVESSATPVTWRQRHNLAWGATHGLAHTLTQLAYLRPRNRHARYLNLYFAGASTHPGTGVPTAVISGRFAAERIADDLGR
ncbi:MAG TPA: phytoene desaturase family protein [Actinotalea sp.]|nr:phytoene desaturase family protein [Actinotalea sp.]